VEIADLLPGPDAVLASVKASGKKALLAELASRAATVFKLDDRRLFDRLLERERLGSTGIGGGIAIPHARLTTLAKPVGMFARLAAPVDFESIDERPVDIVFLLVAPEGAGADHLKALARVSRLLRDRALVEKLRATESAEALYALLVESVQAQSAA
jgi:nitrogen PTS system EIIA component